MPLNDLRQQGTLFGVMPNVICYPAFAIFSRERHFTPVRVTLFPALAGRVDGIPDTGREKRIRTVSRSAEGRKETVRMV